MLRLSRWVAVVAILLSTSVAFAQQQRPGGGQGGRPPGGGGFGGGFGGPGGGMNSPLMLAANEAVQKDLGLKEEQVSKLKTLGEELREEMRPVFAGGFGGGRDLSEEDRNKQREKTAEAMKKVNEKFQPKLNEILDASQRDRLKQIQLQASGPQAYQNADVVAALKLSKDQQDKLASIVKEFGEKQRELGFGEEARVKRSELNEARDKQVAEVLTADQKSEFDKLKGKPFDMAALRGGFGGPGGGRPGQGGGANPGGRPQRKTQDGDKKASTN